MIDHCIVVCAVAVVLTCFYVTTPMIKYTLYTYNCPVDYRDAHALIGQGLHQVFAKKWKMQ